MKPLRLILLFCSAFVGFLSAQTLDVSVCEVLRNPQTFDGKIVRIKGTVVAGFDEFEIKDASCNQPVNAIWLSYPEGSKGKAGPVALAQVQLAKNNPSASPNPSRTQVKLDKNKDFKQFDSLLSTPYKAGGMCLGCTRYSVTATMTGRLDGVKDSGVVRDSDGRFISANGFGNLNLYRARLVLQSVSDVSPHEIDYSKAGAVTKDDTSRELPGGDPVAAAHQEALAFGRGSDAAREVERSAAAYGKPGEDNGVEVGFGVPNEVAKNDGPTGNENSPDGLLINCTFNMDRLKGDALTHAISHVGTHIADLRDPKITASQSTLYELEYRAWQTTVLSSIAAHQRALAVSGGYLLWDASWANADRNVKVDNALNSFLGDWAGLRN